MFGGRTGALLGTIDVADCQGTRTLLSHRIQVSLGNSSQVLKIAISPCAGGYYLAMAASKIVAERLTITGSIGVITGKFNLEKLYGKVGYTKELISKGR